MFIIIIMDIHCKNKTNPARVSYMQKSKNHILEAVRVLENKIK